MAIIDNHAHIFSFSSGKSEYKSKEFHLMYAQKLISGHFEPTNKMYDFATVIKHTIWGNRPGREGMWYKKQSVCGLCQGKPGPMDWSWCPSRCSPGYNRASGTPPANESR